MSTLQNLEVQERVFELENKKFEVMQRKAKGYISGSILPASYRNVGDVLILEEMSKSLNIPMIMLAQGLYIVKGKPSMSGQLVIAIINGSGRFERPLKWEEKTSPWGIRAYATLDGETLYGEWIDDELIIANGWLSNPHWKNNKGLMAKYRSASWFSRLYCPDLLLGYKTEGEVEDSNIIDTQPLPASTDSQPLKIKIPTAKPQATPAPVVEPDAADADIEEVAKPVADISQVPTPQPTTAPEATQKRKRRSNAEIKELLAEINAYSDIEYTKLSDVPAQVGREATERIQFKKEVTEALHMANSSRDKDTPLFTSLDQVDAMNRMDDKHHVVRVKYINKLKAETPQETKQRYGTATNQAVANAKNPNIPTSLDDADPIPPTNSFDEMPGWDGNQGLDEAMDAFGGQPEAEDFGKVDLANDITQAISERFNTLVSYGMKPEDFQPFIFWSIIDDSNVHYIEEDEAWIRGEIAKFNLSVGQS